MTNDDKQESVLSPYPTYWHWIIRLKPFFMVIYSAIDLFWGRKFTQGTNAVFELSSLSLVFIFVAPFGLFWLEYSALSRSSHQIWRIVNSADFNISRATLSSKSPDVFLLAGLILLNMLVTIGTDLVLGFGPLNLLFHTIGCIAIVTLVVVSIRQIFVIASKQANTRASLDLKLEAAQRLQAFYLKLVTILTGAFAALATVIINSLIQGEMMLNLIRTRFMYNGIVYLPEAITMSLVKYGFAFSFGILCLTIFVMLPLTGYRNDVERVRLLLTSTTPEKEDH